MLSNAGELQQIVDNFDYASAPLYSKDHFQRNWTLALFAVVLISPAFLHHDIFGYIALGVAFFGVTYLAVVKHNRAVHALQEAFPYIPWQNDQWKPFRSVGIQTIKAKQDIYQALPFVPPTVWTRDDMLEALEKMWHKIFYDEMFSKTHNLMTEFQRVFDESEANFTIQKEQRTRTKTDGTKETYWDEVQEKLLTFRLDNKGFGYQLSNSAPAGHINKFARLVQSERLQALLAEINASTTIARWTFNIEHMRMDVQFQPDAAMNI